MILDKVQSFQPSSGAGKRLLFFGEAVSAAHVARPAVLARWAQAAGYEVHFACGERFAFIPRTEGLPTIPLPTIAPSVFFRRLAYGRFMYKAAELLEYVRAELELLKRLKPDLVVGDFRHSLPISAALAGIPSLLLLNAYLSPAHDIRLAPPTAGLGRLLPRALLQALVSMVEPLVFRNFGAALNSVRRCFALPPLNDFREHYSAGTYCAYPDLPEAFSALDLPDRHFFLGPVIWSPHGLLSPDLSKFSNRRPLVYVTLGGSGNAKVLPAVLTQLLAQNCNLAITGVKANEANNLRVRIPALAGRAIFEEFCSPTELLKHAAFTTCHGGSGTIYQSLAAGVPVLCLPHNQDQILAVETAQKTGAVLKTDVRNLPNHTAEMLSGRLTPQARETAEIIRRQDTRRRWLNFLSRHEFLGSNHSVNRSVLAEKATSTFGMGVYEKSNFVKIAEKKCVNSTGIRTLRFEEKSKCIGTLELRNKRETTKINFLKKLCANAPLGGVSVLEREDTGHVCLNVCPKESCKFSHCRDSRRKNMMTKNRVAERRTENNSTDSFTNLSDAFVSVVRKLRAFAEEGPEEWNIKAGGGSKYRLLVANTSELRERAFRLGSRVYKEMGYIKEQSQALLYSRFDARSDTFVLLVADEHNHDVATMTLVFDSEEEGLPLDDIFCPEADKLRTRGKRTAEIVRLAVDGKIGGGREIILHLFNFAYVYAKHVEKCDGFLITVNPRHVPFYVRSWGFEVIGAERACPKVQNAPAVLLYLCFVYVSTRAWREAGRPAKPGDRSSLYPYAYPPEAEPFIASFLRQRHAPMSAEEALQLGLR
jgi:UDP:flavonoid glycosyltransferase YjiC (YdhE family)